MNVRTFKIILVIVGSIVLIRLMWSYINGSDDAKRFYNKLIAPAMRR
ncbi:MAG: hypothetical protein WC515_01835 [Candidatus Omnitrophota bacterium]